MDEGCKLPWSTRTVARKPFMANSWVDTWVLDSTEHTLMAFRVIGSTLGQMGRKCGLHFREALDVFREKISFKIHSLS